MKKVTIYTGHPCPRCNEAKALLKGKNIEFNEINVWEKKENAKEMLHELMVHEPFLKFLLKTIILVAKKS